MIIQWSVGNQNDEPMIILSHYTREEMIEDQ